MILRYSRSDGSKQPAENETVELADDGRISGWRTVSDRAVGSFAGQLPPAEVRSLQSLVQQAVDAPVPTQAPAPGSATEALEIADKEALPAAGFVDGPWVDLLDAARDLLDRLCDFPYAAIGIEVSDGRAQLEHLGGSGLILDLSGAELHIAAWHGYYERAEEETVQLAAPGRIEATAGWVHSIELPPNVTEDLPKDDDVTLHVSVTFRIRSEPATDVKLSYTPLISPSN